MSITDRIWVRRSLLVAAAAALVVLMITPTMHLYGRITEPPSDSEKSWNGEPVDLASFEGPDLADEDNAATWLVAGAGAVVWSKEDSAKIGEASLEPFEDWSSELRKETESALERYHGALETLHVAAELEHSSYGIRYSDGLEAEMPDFLSLITASRLLLAEARVAFAHDDPDRGLVAFATLSRLASSLEEESATLTALIGLASERMLLVAAAETAGSDRPWAGQHAFLDELEATLSPVDLVAMLSRTFAVWAGTLCQSVERGPGQGPEEADQSPGKPDEPDCAEILEAGLRAVEASIVPYGSDPERFEKTDGFMKSLSEPVMSDLLKSFGSVIARAQSVNAQRQLVRAAIEMRRIGADSGSYPRKRPGIPELAEPNPFTDELIGYELQEDGSLRLELVGAGELLAPTTVPGMSKIIAPVVLPAPGS
ncbi:MAG: hypothetical protein ACC742_16695 [Thermoanaerobaculales bacterium]